MENFKLPKWYLSQRKAWRHHYGDENFQAVIKESLSPCNAFLFTVSSYRKQEKGWEDYLYYKGTIYPQDNQNSKIELFSNARKFWHFWIQKEKKLYLVCNEDLNGYTVVDVKDRIILPYIDPKKEWSFAWKEVLPSPDGRFLAVQGTYMEVVREVALFDISDPTNLPFPKVKRLDKDFKGGYLVLKRWDNNRVIMEHVLPHRKPELVEVTQDEEEEAEEIQERHCRCF